MTMIDPAIVPQRTLYTGAKMPAVGMGTFGSDHADADAVCRSSLPARYFRGLCESGHHASSAVDTGLSFRA